MRELIAKLYIQFDEGKLSWNDFLIGARQICIEAGEDGEPFCEFLEVMETTSYPEEKQSYQVVEVQCTYAGEIEWLGGSGSQANESNNLG